jgi:hypothetical protein
MPSVEFIKGHRYNWIGQSERLEFAGTTRYGNDPRVWYQFEKIDQPGEVWCEVLASDLSSFEETKQ